MLSYLGKWFRIMKEKIQQLFCSLHIDKQVHRHTMSSKLTPVSGCAVHASSVVAHFVSINVSVHGGTKNTSRSDKEEQGEKGQ